MTTVSVKDEYIEILTALGDVQAAIDLAVQCYAISQITAKVAELKKNEAKYRAKYGIDYPTFAQRIGQAQIQMLQAKGVNILSNALPGAGQSVMHFHVHVIPRFGPQDRLKIEMLQNQSKDALNLPALVSQLKSAIDLK